GCENAATRLLDRFRDAWDVRDRERVAACFAPGYRTMDRRRMARIEFDRDAQPQSPRFGFELRTCRFADRLLATRGERLALVLTRCDYEGAEGGAGPSELELLQVLEVDDHGDAVAIVVFDPDDPEAAYAELDRRHAAGEPAVHGRAAVRTDRG